jgi:galactokinase
MGQFVSRLGKQGHALFLDCRTLQYEFIPFSFDGLALLIVDTKIKRELARSAYNKRRAECSEAVHYFSSISSS